MKYENYFLEAKDNITFADLKNLRIFYLPFLGPDATILYQYFVDQFEQMISSRDLFNSSDIAKLINLTPEALLKAKNKLEAIGLLRSFESNLYKTQIISVIKPLTPEQINSNKIICAEIIKKIGLENLENLLSKHLNYHFDKEEYNETSKHFYDVYKLKIEQLNIISNREQIINKMTKVKKDTNVAILSSIEYFESLSKRKIAPSVRQELANLSQKGFDSQAINHLLNFSYQVNNGEINIKYVVTIANSYLAKNIIAADDVAAELNESLIHKTKPKRKINYKTKDVIENIRTKDNFQFDEEDKQNSFFETVVVNQIQQKKMPNNNFATNAQLPKSESKSIDEVLEDLFK